MGGEQDSVFWRDRAACARPGMDARWCYASCLRAHREAFRAIVPVGEVRAEVA